MQAPVSLSRAARAWWVAALALPVLGWGCQSTPPPPRAASPTPPAASAAQATPEPEQAPEPAPEATPPPNGMAPILQPFRGDLDGE